MKKLFVICLSLIMVLSSFSFCFADQTFYIDPSTGSVVNDPNSASSAISGEVALSSDCRYDKSSKVYIYPTEAINGACVRANVYNGMVVTSPVIISVDSGAMVSVYLEGEPISEDTYGNITELGVYIVRDESADREMFRFTIVNKITGALSSYNVPDILFICLSPEFVPPQHQNWFSWMINYFNKFFDCNFKIEKRVSQPRIQEW